MYAEVIIDITNEAVDRAFTYRIPEGLDLQPGDRVLVPFGRSGRKKDAYVVSILEETDLESSRIKEVCGKTEKAISVREELLRLALWMSVEYGTTRNQCLKTVLPVRSTVRKNSRREDPIESLLGNFSENPDSSPRNGFSGREREIVLNEEQKKAAATVIRAFRACFDGSSCPAGALSCQNPELSNSILTDGPSCPAGASSSRNPEFSNPALKGGPESPAGASPYQNSQQSNAVSRFLLHGITGSGKTEVYLEIMEAVLQAERQVIFLIPEISLAFQTVKRIASRFPGKVALLHSRMSAGERYEQYERCAGGSASILVGPRSAVFAPFPRLGLIIMDEEHEGAYKSETAPRYETRDVARMRAQLSGCPILYGSATPSLSIYAEAVSGNVCLLRLNRRAKEGSMLARTEIIDLRKEIRDGNRSVFSRRLHSLIEEKLGRKEQIMLFMNRRGFSSFVSCRSCGEAIRCPHCDISLTLHLDGTLRCHYCDYSLPLMKLCPSCGKPYLAPFGIGTEKLEELAKKEFPSATVLRMDADTTKNKGGYEKILGRFRAHQADILIGTQMIVKGHDFPDVTLVGLIAADMSLYAPDFRAQERTFQLITQAAGRAGRDRDGGNVIIQTYQPDHYAIRLSRTQNYELFFEKEYSFRQLLGYPPVEKLMTIQMSSGDEDFLTITAEQAVRSVSACCASHSAELIGPLCASVYKIKDIFRKIVYIKHPSHDIIIKLRDEFTSRFREIDRRGLVLLNYDLQ